MATTTTTTATEASTGNIAHGIPFVSNKTGKHGPISTLETSQQTAEDVVSTTLNGSLDASPRPTGLKFWLIILTLASILILISVDNNIVATAVPSITDHFHSVADVGWYSSIFRLCYCSFQFLFGKAYRLFSIKRIFLLANIILILGSLLCGVATTSKMLIIGRAVAGLGSAGLLSGCYVILVRITDLRRRPMFTGVLGAVDGGAALAAPIIGGVLTQSLGWRWCFYINLPLAAATLLLTVFCFEDPQISSEIARMGMKEKLWQLDLVSNLLFIPALTSLFLALSWAGTKYPWSSGAVVGPLVAFAILLAAFIYNQIRRGDNAALPVRILKRRSVIAGAIFIAFSNSTGQVLEYYLPPYYQVVRGYSPAKSSYLLLPYILIGITGSLIHGFGTSAIGYYTPFMLFASLIMPIASGLITTFKVTTSLAQLIAYTGFAGLAIGIGFSGPQNAVQTTLPHDDVPLGTSIMLFAQSFGPAVSVAIAQVLFTNQLSENLKPLIPGFDGVGNVGLGQIVTSVEVGKKTEVLMAIDESLSKTWYFVVAMGCVSIVGSGLMEWRSVKVRRG